MEFKSSYYILIGLVGLVFWLVEYFKITKVPQIFIPARYFRHRARIIRFFVCIIGIAAWISLSISLGGPRRILGYAQQDMEVNDIFFVVDVSASMTAVDFKPNRLEVAKQQILKFIGLRPTDRIGIIIFGHNPFTLLPLSTDLKLVKQMVEEIQIGISGVGSGTNIGDALGLAVARSVQSLSKNKTIILLTDGVSNVGNLTPQQAAQHSKDEGIKIYAIAIGGDENAYMPAFDQQGRVLKNRFGQTMMQRIPGGGIDTKVLDEITQITGGKSFVAQNEQSLSQILSEINRLERIKIKGQGRIIYDELYLNFLILGLCGLLFVELLRRIVLREGL